MLQEAGRLELPDLPDGYFFRVRPWHFFDLPGVKVQLRKRWRWGSGSFKVDSRVGFPELLELDTDAELAVELAHRLRDQLLRQRRRVNLEGLA